MKYADYSVDYESVTFPSIPEFTSRVVLDNVVKVLEIPPSGEVVVNVELPDERFTTMSFEVSFGSFAYSLVKTHLCCKKVNAMFKTV